MCKIIHFTYDRRTCFCTGRTKERDELAEKWPSVTCNGCLIKRIVESSNLRYTTMMKNLRSRVNLEDIAEAMAIGTPNDEYYLDIESGEIIWLSDEIPLDNIEEIRGRIESGLEIRYFYIPYMSSDEAYNDMENFIDNLPEGDLKEKLYIAIRSRGPFRCFKDVLLNFPDVREKWFEFMDSKNLKRAKLWLEVQGFEVGGMREKKTRMSGL